jgi:hypothetical protein
MVVRLAQLLVMINIHVILQSVIDLVSLLTGRITVHALLSVVMVSKNVLVMLLKPQLVLVCLAQPLRTLITATTSVNIVLWVHLKKMVLVITLVLFLVQGYSLNVVCVVIPLLLPTLLIMALLLVLISVLVTTLHGWKIALFHAAQLIVL